MSVIQNINNFFLKLVELLIASRVNLNAYPINFYNLNNE